QPAIQPNDMLLVSAWPYRSADPAPGDIVVFQYPLDRSTLFAKRLIAAGGATLQIRDGVPFVNGKAVDEPYVDPQNNTREVTPRTCWVRVQAKGFFVLGDTRDNGDDSRFWGFVPRSHIVGKVVSGGP